MAIVWEPGLRLVTQSQDDAQDDDWIYPLGWDSTYEIVRALMAAHPDAHVEDIGLQELKAMILALPAFEDDPALAHDDLLCEILKEWYEESTADFSGI